MAPAIFARASLCPLRRGCPPRCREAAIPPFRKTCPAPCCVSWSDVACHPALVEDELGTRKRVTMAVFPSLEADQALYQAKGEGRNPVTHRRDIADR